MPDTFLIRSRPNSEIKFSLLLTPVWWILGLEQFFWSLLFGWIALKLVITQRYRIRTCRTLNLLLIFLLVQLISALFIEETYRILSFLRNLNSNAASFLLVFIIYNSVNSWQQVKEILNALLTVMGISALMGFLGIFDIWRPNFPSVFSFFIPEVLKTTDLGYYFVYRYLGYSAWFIGIEEIFRLKSFFMVPTLYATAIVISVPVTLFVINTAKTPLFRLTMVFILLGLIINLLFTTARIPILSLLASMFFFLPYSQFVQKRRRSAIVLLTTLSGIAITLISLLDVGSLIDLLVYARGSGSFESRSLVYRYTFIEFWERPIFGWGTERDDYRTGYPLGSHSYYLGILFRHGLVGLTILLLIFANLWLETKPLKAGNRRDSEEIKIKNRFLIYGRWSILAIIINSSSDAMDLDMLTFTIIWTVFALLLATRRIIIKDITEPRRNNELPSSYYRF